MPHSRNYMTTVIPRDELTTTVLSAVQSLPQDKKAAFLLDTALSLLAAGKYGDAIENYIDVYLRTPGLEKENMARALIARGEARRIAGEKLLIKAKQDFQVAATLEPSNRLVQAYLTGNNIHFVDSPAYSRAPVEVWDRIASHIPRYHLRAWLFLSSFHRNIAVRRIFHTVDLYFGDDQTDNVHKGLDLFDRVKADRNFAKRVKSLKIHWAYEEGDMLDIMMRIFRVALPCFTTLKEFEWVGYPELRHETVQVVTESHPNLSSLGLIGWHFDAEGVSALRHLHKFTLRAEDDDGWADMGEVRSVLDNNEETLKHLCLGAYLKRNHSWDSAFQSVTIKNLTHLDLVDTRISHIVLARIAHAHNLKSLTLHGTFEEPISASVVFSSDHVIDGKHTFLPHLEAFRFVMVGHDDEIGLFQSIVQFLRQRSQLRRLDLGICPWSLVRSVLPDFVKLKVLRVRIDVVNQAVIDSLVNLIPKDIQTIHLSAGTSDKPMDEYASAFASFRTLSMLHLHSGMRRPQLASMSEKEFSEQADIWYSRARNVAMMVPSVDFVGWHGEHYVVIRGEADGIVELKELPPRRRLDCGCGVDLGGEDASWMERKDVPIDYEVPGLET